MKITFLGTNGWYDTLTGNTICTLIETENEYVILDAGNGLYKIDKYICFEKPIYIFLSHFHLDHVIGLHILGKFNFRQGIKIFGPKGIEKMFETLINKPFTSPYRGLRTPVEIRDIESGNNKKPYFMKKKLLMKHSDRCLGYRFELDNKIVAYCTDTGLCENLYMLAENADLLIAECSLRPGHIDNKWGHLSPQSAAGIAKKAKAKKMVLTHFDASAYKNKKDRKEAETIANKKFPNTSAAIEDCVLRV